MRLAATKLVWRFAMIQWMENHPGLAGWIQAIGSLITLWVAIFIPLYQRKQAQHEAEMALAAKVDRTASSAARVFSSLLLIRAPSPFPESPSFRDDILRDIDALPRDLLSFPAQTIRSKAIQPLTAFCHSIVEFASAAANVAETPEFEGDMSGEISWLSCQATIGGALKTIRELKKVAPHMNCHWGEMALREAAEKSELAMSVAMQT